MILRFSLAAVTLYAIGGAALSAAAFIATGDKAMVVYTIGYGIQAVVCGQAVITLAVPKDGGNQ